MSRNGLRAGHIRVRLWRGAHLSFAWRIDIEVDYSFSTISVDKGHALFNEIVVELVQLRAENILTDQSRATWRINHIDANIVYFVRMVSADDYCSEKVAYNSCSTSNTLALRNGRDYYAVELVRGESGFRNDATGTPLV